MCGCCPSLLCCYGQVIAVLEAVNKRRGRFNLYDVVRHAGPGLGHAGIVPCLLICLCLCVLLTGGWVAHS